MAKKKKNVIIKQGLDGWVMTYGDMMSLLLTFFVLIVSFSSMQETKFEQAAKLVGGHAGFGKGSHDLFQAAGLGAGLLEGGIGLSALLVVPLGLWLGDDGVEKALLAGWPTTGRST